MNSNQSSIFFPKTTGQCHSHVQLDDYIMRYCVHSDTQVKHFRVHSCLWVYLWYVAPPCINKMKIWVLWYEGAPEGFPVYQRQTNNNDWAIAQNKLILTLPDPLIGSRDHSNCQKCICKLNPGRLLHSLSPQYWLEGGSAIPGPN